MAMLPMAAVSDVSADMVRAALARKHSGDVFVAECKNGPTHTAVSLRKLDAWVLLKTWSPITSIGYEIKVSRSDFLRDDKMAAYLPYCHLFYLVAPKGLIALDELPAHTGLIEVIGKSGDRLVTRKKAPRRSITIPEDLLVYVLMCRARIDAEYNPHERPSRMAELQRWIDDAHARQELSGAVNRKIRERFSEQALRQNELALKIQRLESVERRIRELGFDPDDAYDSWQITKRLQEIAGIVPNDIDGIIHRAEQALTNVRRAFSDIKQKGAA